MDGPTPLYTQVLPPAYVGPWAGAAAFAAFAHIACNNATDYAIIQDSVGNTYLNAVSSRSLFFRLGNANVGSFNGTAFSLVGDLVMAANFTKTSAGSTITLNLNNKSGASFPCSDFNLPNGGIYRVAEVSVAGINDVFFQAVPNGSGGYGSFEPFGGAGAIVGTGGGTTPVIFKTNRIEAGRFNGDGTFQTTFDTYLHAGTAVPTLTGNSQVSFYLDEAGNNLKFRVKYSNGTLKTGSIPLS